MYRLKYTNTVLQGPKSLFPLLNVYKVNITKNADVIYHIYVI